MPRTIPERKIHKIHEYAKNPEYQHGTGCDCEKYFLMKDNCPGEGIPNAYKISKYLGISIIAVKCHLYPEKREIITQRVYDYLDTEKGKTTRENYEKSEEGKAARKKAMKNYKRKQKGE